MHNPYTRLQSHCHRNAIARRYLAQPLLSPSRLGTSAGNQLLSRGADVAYGAHYRPTPLMTSSVRLIDQTTLGKDTYMLSGANRGPFRAPDFNHRSWDKSLSSGALG